MNRSQIHEIHSLDLPALHPYRTLRRPQEHIQSGIFVAEGEKVVRRLLDSSHKVISLLLTSRWLDLLSKEYSLNTPEIFVADKALLETIVGYPLHQGIMAVGRVPEEPNLKDFLQRVKQPFLLVGLDGIVSAENVGLILRNCGAFGVDGILCDKSSSSPYLRRAVRNSMGAVFRLPVMHVHLADVLPELECKVLATTPASDVPLEKADLSGNLCVVFGNEGSGISDAVLRSCDVRVGIPMMNGTDSLNVASASAVFLYEIRKARTLKNSPQSTRHLM